LTNGAFGYVPTAEAFPHGGYEVLVSRYTQGTGEEFANEQIRLLNLCKNAG
jgi:aromatic ring hydroxylase